MPSRVARSQRAHSWRSMKGGWSSRAPTRSRWRGRLCPVRLRPDLVTRVVAGQAEPVRVPSPRRLDGPAVSALVQPPGRPARSIRPRLDPSPRRRARGGRSAGPDRHGRVPDGDPRRAGLRPGPDPARRAGGRRLRRAGAAGRHLSVEISLRGQPPRPVEVLAHEGEPHVLLGRDVLNHHRLLLDGPGLAMEIH